MIRCPECGGHMVMDCHHDNEGCAEYQCLECGYVRVVEDGYAEEGDVDFHE